MSRADMIIERFLHGESTTTIARTLNISTRTVQRYLHTAAARARLDELRAERVQALADRSTTYTRTALDILHDIATDETRRDMARVLAARALIDATLRILDIAELLTRIQRLEQRSLEQRSTE